MKIPILGFSLAALTFFVAFLYQTQADGLGKDQPWNLANAGAALLGTGASIVTGQPIGFVASGTMAISEIRDAILNPGRKKQAILARNVFGGFTIFFLVFGSVALWIFRCGGFYVAAPSRLELGSSQINAANEKSERT